MPKCTSKTTPFPRIKRQQIEAEFSGGDISSDGGVLLLTQADNRLNLIGRLAANISDDRDQNRVKHTVESMLRQRVFGIALGWEDLNDHNSLRDDPAIQTALGNSDSLASAPTLSRFEGKASREIAWTIHEAYVQSFIESYKRPPEEIILDIDATDDRVHGNQQGKFFQGYYGHYCFLPLYVFCGEHMLVSYLRPSNRDGARHAGAIMRILVKRIRQDWPDTKIILRADSGFCRRPLIHWCEHNDVYFLIGLAKNARLLDSGTKERLQMVDDVRREYGLWRFCHYESRQYQAGSWPRSRRVIAKLEANEKGLNPRFVVTNLKAEPRAIYKEYCQRGEMENRIKEQQLGLFADRTSCTWWWPNQLRLCLSSLAYVLVHAIRRIGLIGTNMAKAQVTTIRLNLFKIGAIILKNTRRIRFLMPSAHPHQDTWMLAAKRLALE